ncbi:MAG TPA: DUF1254 domain-containing protein [Candidatus Polarisedimenticolia bacterium]|nr:DUF1254 domain-containing protein [Candidatus Polarisedimenticolia bacterium]
MKRLLVAAAVVACAATAMLQAAPAAKPPRKAPPPPAGPDPARRSFERRAVEAAIWGMPAVSMAAFRKSLPGIGAEANQVIYFSKPLEPRHELLTANNNTPYVFSVLDTRSGPVVLEVPPAGDKVVLFGSAIDSWEVPLVDVGPTGDDAGQGGKYLFLPPGYDQEVPEGYLVVPSTTYFVHVALRPIIAQGGKLEDAVVTSKTLKVYPLVQAANPETRYVDAYPKPWKTLPVYDVTFFRDLAQVVKDEPAQEKDAAMLGLLASIGIEKGKPFDPTGETARGFDQAAREAYAAMQDYFITMGKGQLQVWPDRQWGGLNLTQKEGFTFVQNGILRVDERAGGFAFLGTWLPKKLGAASAYLTAVRDSTGKPLSGQKSYRLQVPADVPVRDFWSVIAYSLKTKSMIPNPIRAGLSSYDKPRMKMNADGSVDLYFGPRPPAGKETNWIPTDEDFFLMFRLYGPAEGFAESWKLPDVELMNGPQK